MRLAHCAQVVPYILTRMLRATSFDEVLSHVRERVATGQVYLVVLAYWMAVALTRRLVGRRLLGRQGDMTDEGTTKRKQ